MRKRVFGLFDPTDNTWEAVNCGDESIWQVKPKKRKQFQTMKEAVKHMNAHGYIRGIYPRPFYIVTKSRTLDPKVQAVVDAARDYVSANPGVDSQLGYDNMKKAVRALDGK